jgi:hypothetical protein
VGHVIADFQIADCRFVSYASPIGNRKSAIGNDMTHTLPRCGTDFFNLVAALLRPSSPLRHREHKEGTEIKVGFVSDKES